MCVAEKGPPGQCDGCKKVVSPKEKYFEIPSPSPRIPWIVRCAACQANLATGGLARPLTACPRAEQLQLRRLRRNHCSAGEDEGPPPWRRLLTWAVGAQEARGQALPH